VKKPAITKIKRLFTRIRLAKSFAWYRCAQTPKEKIIYKSEIVSTSGDIKPVQHLAALSISIY
jgi:hypothetical protein